MNKADKRLVLIELNEINFDVVEKYISKNPAQFPSLKKLLDCHKIKTSSENNYEELEPWIQWTSVHTAKSFAQHGIFRLGDIVGAKVAQIFEIVEDAGYKVGAISAMNAENRLKNPAYFIPDPWTQTPSDGTFWSRSLTEAVAQAVNDNAKAKITLKSALQLALALLRFAKPKNYVLYFNLIANSRKRPWNKALVLDLLLHDVHLSFWDTTTPNFSTLFLNGGAHIQHHYFFNSAPLQGVLPFKNPEWYISQKEDPLADVLKLYDAIIGEYLDRAGVELLVATGLAQKPYDRLKFYYRLNAHADFLNSLGIKFSNVYPRMTRDFLIEFSNDDGARLAQSVLADLKVEGDGLRLFGEIDNRGRTLFVTLTYPKEVLETTKYTFNSESYFLKPLVSFVAIKNGMHQSEGFAFFSNNLVKYAPIDSLHVGNIGNSIADYFEVRV
jgi:hypothetical protein